MAQGMTGPIIDLRPVAGLPDRQGAPMPINPGAKPASKARPLTFMSVNTQFDNLGDALINRELALALSTRTETYLDLSRCPESFARTMAVSEEPAIHILRGSGYARLIAIMLAARLRGRTCFFFLNPGGLGGKLRGRKAIGMAIYNLILSALAFTGVRVAMVGVSFDPMGSREGLLWRWRTSLLRTFWVRDAISADNLLRSGIKTHGIMPDLSFGLYTEGEGDDGATTDRSDIAFSFRFDKGHAASSEQLHRLVESIVSAHGPNRRYRFVAQVQRDAAPMTALFEQARARVGEHASLYIVTDDIGACLDAYAGCAVIYSNRLHAILLAVRAGAAPCAVLAPGSTDKFQGIFADLGISDQIHWLDGRPLPPAWPHPVDAKLLGAQADLLNRRFDTLLGPRVHTAARIIRPEQTESGTRS